MFRCVSSSWRDIVDVFDIDRWKMPFDAVGCFEMRSWTSTSLSCPGNAFARCHLAGDMTWCGFIKMPVREVEGDWALALS